MDAKQIRFVDDGQPTTFSSTVRQLSANGESEASAVRRSVDLVPKSYAAWLRSDQRGDGFKLQHGLDEGTAEAFLAAVRAVQLTGGSEAEAVRFCARELPESHRAWLEAGGSSSSLKV